MNTPPKIIILPNTRIHTHARTSHHLCSLLNSTGGWSQDVNIPPPHTTDYSYKHIHAHAHTLMFAHTHMHTPYTNHIAC